MLIHFPQPVTITKRSFCGAVSCEINSYRKLRPLFNIRVKFLYFYFGCLAAHSLSVYKSMISKKTIFGSFKRSLLKEAHIRFCHGFIRWREGQIRSLTTTKTLKSRCKEPLKNPVKTSFYLVTNRFNFVTQTFDIKNNYD